MNFIMYLYTIIVKNWFNIRYLLIIVLYGLMWIYVFISFISKCHVKNFPTHCHIVLYKRNNLFSMIWNLFWNINFHLRKEIKLLSERHSKNNKTYCYIENTFDICNSNARTILVNYFLSKWKWYQECSVNFIMNYSSTHFWVIHEFNPCGLGD